jgi:hypothetical protein
MFSLFFCSYTILSDSLSSAHVVDDADLIIFQIIDKTIRNSKFRCLSEATLYHHNVFTFWRSLGTFYQNDTLSPPSENKLSLT